ncbi:MULTISPECIES: RidA family protein [Alcaligenes]|uniref:RidA family protein n=1 Tax=Alcaligenes TaxID=507 RepID=UPI001EF0F1ED|nr:MULTISPECIES: RidA family protein [Alcaligenes]MCR4142803.1 RidA family protein [Alcaligenes faecalis]ULH05185.1 RidA family protein [Alcaligenes faecalis]
MSIERFHQNKNMSKYVIHDKIVYMSGQVAMDPSGSFEEQLHQILSQIDEQFEEIGIDRSHILRAMIWIDDYKKWPLLNEIWNAWIPADKKPARSCVESKLAFPQYQVEVEITAAL